MRNQLVLFFVFIFFLFACENNHENIEETIAPICAQFQSDCELIIDSTVLSVKFNKTDLKPEQPFTLYVEPQVGSDINIISITGYIEGLNMYMGKIPLFFNQLKNDNFFQSTSMFGSCSEDKMKWRVWLTVKYIKNDTELKQTAFIDVYSSQ